MQLTLRSLLLLRHVCCLRLRASADQLPCVELCLLPLLRCCLFHVPSSLLCVAVSAAAVAVINAAARGCLHYRPASPHAAILKARSDVAYLDRVYSC